MTGVILFEKYNLPKYFLNVSTGKEFVFMRLFRSAFLSKSLKNEHVKNKQLGSVVNLKPQADFTVAVLLFNLL